MTLADKAQDHFQEALNAEGANPSHVMLGVALCIGIVGLNTAVASLRRQTPGLPGEPNQPSGIRALWPALSSATTLAALRVWNANPSPRRSKALAYWLALQLANTALMISHPRSRSQQLAAALATAALTAAYARAAAYVDEKAADMAAPTGFAGLAAIVAQPNDL
jgi:translocator protein